MARKASAEKGSMLLGKPITSKTYLISDAVALSTPGNKLEVNGNIVNSSPTTGWIGLTGDLPGYPNGVFPTLKTNSPYLYFSAGGYYSGYIGNNIFGLFNNATNPITENVHLNVSGSSWLNGGNVGIGTSSPSETLNVNGTIGLGKFSDNDNYAGMTMSYVDGGTGSTYFTGNRWGQRWSWVTNTQNGHLTQMSLDSNNNLGLRQSGTDNVNVWLSPNPGATSYINSGNVLIGKTTQTNAAYLLDVAGSVRANEVVVNTTGADFVFEDAYPLRKLADLEKFIKENKHLPDIAPARDMQTKGESIGEMNTKLLQKVEELTLYLIEANKKIQNQNQRLEALEQTNK